MEVLGSAQTHASAADGRASRQALLQRLAALLRAHRRDLYRKAAREKFMCVLCRKQTGPWRRETERHECEPCYVARAELLRAERDRRNRTSGGWNRHLSSALGPGGSTGETVHVRAHTRRAPKR